jgi:hypothetical protein
MKYLDKFYNYIKESQEDIIDLTKEELDDLLLPISDLGIEYSFNTPKIITDGEFSGFTSMNVIFKNNFKTAPMGGYTEMIIDKRFWEFLDELISFKNRLESVQVSINTKWNYAIILTFVQKSKVEGDLFLLQKLFNEMSKKTNASKSDFSNSVVKKINKEELKMVVTCGGWREAQYTDRKWNGLFREVDFSNFNVDKEITEDRSGGKSATITITLKK